jgi:hypothetical protein
MGPKLPNCTTSALRGHVHQRGALPAVALRQRDAHQSLLGDDCRGVERKAWIVGALERIPGEMLAREATHLFGKLLLFVGEIEIHPVFRRFIFVLFSWPERTRA